MDPSESPAAAELLSAQLERARGLLGTYSGRFFAHMRWYTAVVIALLVLGSTDVAGAAVVLVPFVIPFVFLEAGYLFYYTAFARRYAASIERVLNRREGRPVLIAHRLEAAYFYPPEAPRISAISLVRPLGMMSAATIGYTVMAGLGWLAGLVGTAEWVDRHLTGGPAGLVVPAAVAWTATVAAYLVLYFLRAPDERRLVVELERWEGEMEAEMEGRGA
jgi:hypothetical protein